MHYKSDIWYMKKALALARKAFNHQEIPIGALVVDPYGTIRGRGENCVERLKCQTAHAEIRAIEQACRKVKDWRLAKYTLYVTLEPCMMCIGLSSLSRIERIVFGASSPLFGYRLADTDKKVHYMKYLKNITAGVLADESILLLKQFFQTKRNMHHE